jgi:mono/diheme cytochrome c family protein
MLHLIRRQRRICLEAIVLLGFLLLIAYSMSTLAAHMSPPKTECPQSRFTGQAPPELYARANPLESNRRNRRAGKELFEDLSNPSCVACHGKIGDGRGQLAGQFDPPPRNFACASAVEGIPDGQLHWIIKNGSPAAAMPPFDYLTDEEIWQLVIYLRSLVDHK